MVNGSNIYRKCWSLKGNKACFRHKELSYCFDRSAAVLFLVDMACYDQFGSNSTCNGHSHRRRGADNAMNGTIKLFQWLLKDYSLFLKKRRLESGHVVVVMDGLQRFKDKIEGDIPISRCSSFRKYTGGSMYEESRDFVASKFRALCVYSNITLSVHFHEVGDTQRNVDLVKLLTEDRSE